MAVAGPAAGCRPGRPARDQQADGGIQIGQCGSPKYANVYAQYGHDSGKLISLIQDDAPRATPCSNIGIATTLGHYKVDGRSGGAIRGGAGGGMPGGPALSRRHGLKVLALATGGADICG